MQRPPSTLHTGFSRLGHILNVATIEWFDPLTHFLNELTADKSRTQSRSKENLAIKMTVKIERRHTAHQNSGKRVYIRSKDNAWEPVLQLNVVKRSDGKQTKKMACIVREQGPKKTRSPPVLIDLSDYPNAVLPMQNVDSKGKLQDYNDMVDLPFMHEVSEIRGDNVQHCADSGVDNGADNGVDNGADNGADNGFDSDVNAKDAVLCL
jgi:hypothetical protein